jgi:hypothetical protein
VGGKLAYRAGVGGVDPFNMTVEIIAKENIRIRTAKGLGFNHLRRILLRSALYVGNLSSSWMLLNGDWSLPYVWFVSFAREGVLRY